jgi:hypothetical protein
MAYSNFSIESVSSEFRLSVSDQADLFGPIPPVEVGAHLAGHLEEYVPLAIGIGTEKGRSELIVAPMLLDVRRRMGGSIGFFSGVEFNVDASRGLNGVCDFLLSKSRLQVMVTAPVLAVVEAKKDDIRSGLGQCASEMIAVQVFNERAGQSPSTVYGVVTTGTTWRFLRLDGAALAIDRLEYSIEHAGKVLGVLLHCVGGTP